MIPLSPPGEERSLLVAKLRARACLAQPVAKYRPS